MNHCLAQVFRVGLSLGLPKRDCVSGSVVFQNQRMIHRDICRTLFKRTYRVTPRGHDIDQQLVRFRYRVGGAINEARLDCAPGLYEACAIACRELPDVQPLNSLCALFEPGFPMPPVAAFLDCACIFSATELSAKLFRAALSVQKECHDAYKENHDESND
jgi:hypothetical protein